MTTADLPPALGVARVLVVGTGSISVAFLPALVHVLRFRYGVETAVAVTAAARRLVSVEALAALSGRPVVQPEWPANPAAGAEHVRWARWVELVVVWPATLHFMARCAYGLAGDVPSAVVLATQAPVIFAPSWLNDAGGRNLHTRIVAALREDRHTVMDPVAAASVTSGEVAGGAAAPLEAVLRAIPRVVEGMPGHQRPDPDTDEGAAHDDVASRPGPR